MTREEAQAAYAEAEEQMNEAAAELRKYGIYAASPEELRVQRADFLSRLANIARIAKDDKVLCLCTGVLPESTTFYKITKKRFDQEYPRGTGTWLAKDETVITDRRARASQALGAATRENKARDKYPGSSHWVTTVETAEAFLNWTPYGESK